MLVPIEILQHSEAPFLDAAKSMGRFGSILIASGVLISTAGSVNGNILLSGQMPMALALDSLAPKILAKKIEVALLQYQLFSHVLFQHFY